MMHFNYPDQNWCPDCGLPINLCDCEENRIAYEMLYGDEPDYDPGDTQPMPALFEDEDESTP